MPVPRISPLHRGSLFCALCALLRSLSGPCLGDCKTASTVSNVCPLFPSFPRFPLLPFSCSFARGAWSTAAGPLTAGDFLRDVPTAFAFGPSSSALGGPEPSLCFANCEVTRHADCDTFPVPLLIINQARTPTGRPSSH